jgi:hypothetical protein
MLFVDAWRAQRIKGELLGLGKAARLWPAKITGFKLLETRIVRPDYYVNPFGYQNIFEVIVAGEEKPLRIVFDPIEHMPLNRLGGRPDFNAEIEKATAYLQGIGLDHLNLLMGSGYYPTLTAA